MTKRAIYAGTFAPVTLGHLDIIVAASALFDQLVIAVSSYQRAELALTQSCRISLIEAATKNLANITVVPLNGSLVECATQHQANWLVRGLRCAQDFDYEQSMAHMNQVLAPNLETVFLQAKLEHRAIQATLVRQLMACQQDISAFVPQAVIDWMNAVA